MEVVMRSSVFWQHAILACFHVQCSRTMRNFKPIDPVALKESFQAAYPGGITYKDIKFIELEAVVCMVKLGLIDMALLEQAVQTEEF